MHAVRTLIAGAVLMVGISHAEVLHASDATYRTALETLRPGDTLYLAPGRYTQLPVVGVNGTEDGWIAISGPSSGPPAVITPGRDTNAVEIVNSSYVSLENLRIDSCGLPGAAGVSAKGENNHTHNIRLNNNVFVGQGAGQQTDAISTKTTTWGWVIRLNRIIGAGTGMYLGNSDGSAPFIAGVIENNLVADTIGYNLEIKHQNTLGSTAGAPLGPTTTIIRHNVFIKDDRPSPDGDRPNVLIGPAPFTGNGALNTYELYGNVFVHNHREALLQASGRVSVHDNLFVDGPATYAAVVFRYHNGPVKVANFYNNTVFTSGPGVYFGMRATLSDAVVGNAIFATKPVSGTVMTQNKNLFDSPENASRHLVNPSFDIAKTSFLPLPDRCTGPAVDLSDFRSDVDYTRDFEGRSKVAGTRGVVYRGAYAGADDLAWNIQRGIKPPPAPVPASVVDLVWISPDRGVRGRRVDVTLTGSNLKRASVDVSGSGVTVLDVANESNRLTASLAIANNAAPGSRQVRIRTPDGVSNPLNFRVTTGAP